MKKSKLIIIALITALCLTGCNNPDALNQNSDPDNQSSQPQESTQSTAEAPTSQPSEPVIEFRIIPDAISDLGLTYDQMVEKRGKLRSNTYKGVLFENGIGVYAWKTEDGSFFTDDHTDPGGLPDAGGCNIIDGLKPEELFEGLTYPVSMDMFSDKYGFVPVYIGKEKGLNDCYYSSFTHPMYENLEFTFCTEEYGMIEKDTSCILSLDVDSLDAKPVIPPNSTTQTAASSHIRTDTLSDLGLTYDQMVEKRGKLKSNTSKGVLFENGIGYYGWQSYEKTFFTDDPLSPGGLPDAGGCNMIDGLKSEDLFEGLTYPINVYVLSDKYGFVIGFEGGYDGHSWSVLTHPTYEDLEFNIDTNIDTKGFAMIDKDSTCSISLKMDSLDAKPIIPPDPTVQTAAKPRILTDALSDLGLTYDQMVEKRGKLRSNTYKGVRFENGIGGYGWKSEGKAFWIDNDHTDPGGLPDAGGCNWIIGLSSEDLFEGVTYPVSMDIFSDKFGLVPIEINEKDLIDGLYWSTFIHPAYENVEFIFCTEEYDMIDKDSSCTLSLDIDSLEAKPVIPANPSTTTRILTEPLSDLGLTYDQMIEKRGEVLAESVKGIKFKNGLGMYGWRSDLVSYADSSYNKEGGCNMIFWFKPDELFEGLTYPISIEDFTDKYGLVPISVGKENGLYDCYASEFSHPEYKDVRYLLLTDKPDAIDADSSCDISLAVDALNAKPVI